MVQRWHPVMFYNELDWLECQLVETYDVMHRYILVEATLDHQGHEKPLYYDDNQSRFGPWSDKIIHIIVRDLPTAQQTANHWERERPQRDAAMRVLFEHADPGDLILNMDVDEIPSRVAMTAETDRILGLELSNHLFAVNWYAEQNVMGTLIPMHQLDRRMDPSELPGAVHGGLSWIREHRYGYPVLPNAGWHFSWVGGPAEYTAKDQRSPHVEDSVNRMRPGAAEDSYRIGGGFQVPVEVGPDWPRYIRERRCPPNWFRPRDPT
jgi:Glycosyltransferase family 17